LHLLHAPLLLLVALAFLAFASAWLLLSVLLLLR
jgi:hypothetical protein